MNDSSLPIVTSMQIVFKWQLEVKSHLLVCLIVQNNHPTINSSLPRLPVIHVHVVCSTLVSLPCTYVLQVMIVLEFMLKGDLRRVLLNLTPEYVLCAISLYILRTSSGYKQILVFSLFAPFVRMQYFTMSSVVHSTGTVCMSFNYMFPLLHKCTYNIRHLQMYGSLLALPTLSFTLKCTYVYIISWSLHWTHALLCLPCICCILTDSMWCSPHPALGPLLMKVCQSSCWPSAKRLLRVWGTSQGEGSSTGTWQQGTSCSARSSVARLVYSNMTITTITNSHSYEEYSDCLFVCVYRVYILP